MTSNHQQQQEQQVSAEDQRAPSTGQPGVDQETLTAMAWERDEALKRADARFVSMERHATFLACESADRLAWRLAYRYCEDVPALLEQLAAAQAERAEPDPLEVVTLGDGSGFEGYHVCATCSEPIDPRKPDTFFGSEQAYFHKRACQLTAGAFRLHLLASNLRAQIEELRQRASDYEAAEGTAVAQRNAALNEALAYKYQAEAMRGVLIDLVVGRTCEAIDASARSVALAALDAATAGQPATPSNRPHPATSDNDSPTQAQPEVRNAEPSESHPGRHPAEAPGE